MTGRYFEVYGGEMRERFMSETSGYSNPDLTVEDVRDHFDQVLDRSDAATVPVEPRFAAAHTSRYNADALARYSRAAQSEAARP